MAAALKDRSTNILLEQQGGSLFYYHIKAKASVRTVNPHIARFPPQRVAKSDTSSTVYVVAWNLSSRQAHLFQKTSGLQQSFCPTQRLSGSECQLLACSYRFFIFSWQSASYSFATSFSNLMTYFPLCLH